MRKAKKQLLQLFRFFIGFEDVTLVNRPSFFFAYFVYDKSQVLTLCNLVEFLIGRHWLGLTMLRVRHRPHSLAQI